MPDPKLVIDQLKKELDKNPSVLGLVLIGSQGRETIYKADNFSDLETLIIVNDKDVLKVEKKLPVLALKLGKVLFSFKHVVGFVAVYDDLFRIELSIIRQSRIKSVFSRPKLQEVKILINKTDGKLEKILSKRPEKINYQRLFKEKVVNFWYWQIIGAQYLKKGEVYNSRAILNIHASCLIKLFELLNDPDIVLLETNKRVEKFLTKEQLGLLKKITVSYDLAEIKKALMEVMDIFSNLTKQIKNKYGYKYNENIEKELKPKILTLLD